jgi:hypothetical protein
MLHHAVLYRLYTGLPSLDPDVQHSQLRASKTPDIAARKNNGLFALVADKLSMAGLAVYALTPGM